MGSVESAAAISEVAIEWVVRLDRGLSPTEQVALDAWMTADPRHGGALARAQALWLQADRARIYHGTVAAGTAPPARNRSGWSTRWAWAAGFILVLCASITGWRSYDRTHFSTAVGEIRHVPLSDGSSVTLDTGTQVTVRYSGTVRLVRLDRGEALFEVAHDALRPFVVEAGALRVRAVGTAFVVRRHDQTDAEVTVTRGMVDVWRETSVPEPSIRLGAGLRTVATSKALEPAQPLSEVQVARAIAWREGFIDLEGRTLAEAASEFNRYNQQRVVIEDPALARERVVGRFSISDPLSFANAAAAMLGAHVHTEDGRITVEADAGK